MLASSRLFVVVCAVTACHPTSPGVRPVGTDQAASEVARALERMLADQYGITAPVRCPSVIVPPAPGETVNCETTEGGETYRVRARIEERTVAVLTSDSMLFPVAVLESRSDLRLQCPNQRYLRVTLTKPGWCKVVGSGDYLRIKLANVETEAWFRKRITDPIAVTRNELARMKLDATVSCSEPALAEAAPMTCDIKTTSGEQFKNHYKLGASTSEFVLDGKPAVVLPHTVNVKVNTTSEDVALQCPRRVAKRDEAVRCSIISQGKQIWVNVSVDAKGGLNVVTL